MRSIATTSLGSSTTQITAGSRRGSRHTRHCSSCATFPHSEQNRTFALTSDSTCARRRTSAGSAWRMWKAIRCALLGPTPGSLPSSSIRSWTTPSYTPGLPSRGSRSGDDQGDGRGCGDPGIRRRGTRPDPSEGSEGQKGRPGMPPRPWASGPSFSCWSSLRGVVRVVHRGHHEVGEGLGVVRVDGLRVDDQGAQLAGAGDRGPDQAAAGRCPRPWSRPAPAGRRRGPAASSAPAGAAPACSADHRGSRESLLPVPCRTSLVPRIYVTERAYVLVRPSALRRTEDRRCGSSSPGGGA